ALEGPVFADQIVEGSLDVDGGDVVRQQHDLVGVQLAGVLAQQVLGLDQTGLKKTYQEGAGADEGVDDVDAFIGQGAPQVLGEGLFGGANDEVDHLDGGVDDAERISGLGQGGSEKLVVQLDDDALPAFVVVDAFGADPHRVVEVRQGLGLGVQALVVEDVEHPLHGLGDRVVGSEVVVLEQRIEDGLGDDVLGEHVNGVVLVDAGV